MGLFFGDPFEKAMKKAYANTKSGELPDEKHLQTAIDIAMKHPKLKKLFQGPCGQQMCTAFSCFVKNQAPHQDAPATCFKDMMALQNCMGDNVDAFLQYIPGATEAEKQQNADILFAPPGKASPGYVRRKREMERMQQQDQQ